VRKRKLEVLGDELLDVGSADLVGGGELDDFEDMDAPESRAMSGSHVLIQSIDGLGPAHLPILFIHVVGAGATVVSDPDAEVLDLEWALLVDGIEGNNLAVGLLDLAQLHEEVPESGFGDHLVRCEDPHPVQFWCRVAFGRQVAADDLVFVEATHLE